MAVYSTTISASGDNTYNSTAEGYQIGGNDMSDAWIVVNFPDNYSSYDSCSITFTFYSRYSPSSWDDDWWASSNATMVPVYMKYNTGAKQLIWYLEASEFSGYSSSTRNSTFTIDLDNDLGAPAFSPGDTLTFTFDGSDGMFIDSSGGRCLYLVEAEFTSYSATPASQKKYLLVKSYSPVNVSQYSSGTYYVSWADYRKYWGMSWDPGDYMQVTLNGSGGGYYSDVTYYTASQQYLTDSSGRRLYIPD